MDEYGIGCQLKPHSCKTIDGQCGCAIAEQWYERVGAGTHARTHADHLISVLTGVHCLLCCSVPLHHYLTRDQKRFSNESGVTCAVSSYRNGTCAGHWIIPSQANDFSVHTCLHPTNLCTHSGSCETSLQGECNTLPNSFANRPICSNSSFDQCDGEFLTLAEASLPHRVLPARLTLLMVLSPSLSVLCQAA